MDLTPEIAEAMRRRAGLLPSSAGIQGGADRTRSVASPVNQSGQSGSQPVGQGLLPPDPSMANPTAGAQSMMRDAKPGEAQLIIKALTKRLDKLQ